MNADDILNNTDPQELRNIIKRLRMNQDAGLRAVPNVVINEAPNQFPAQPSDAFRAYDEQGRLRMIMSAANLLQEFGIDAHLLGRDENGIPMFWISADDGSGVAGGGAVRLGKDGIAVSDGGDAIIFHDSAYDSYSVFSFRPLADTGGRSALQQLVFEVGDEINQLANGDFETGDLTSWTETDPGAKISVVAGAGDNGSYGLVIAAGATPANFITQNTLVTCGRGVVVQLRARSVAGSSNIEVTNGVDTYALEVPTSDWRNFVFILPSSTTFIKIISFGNNYVDNIIVRRLSTSSSNTPASYVAIDKSAVDILAGNAIRLFLGWGASPFRVDFYKSGGMIVNVNSGDHDVVFKGSTDPKLAVLDAGLDALGLGGDAETGYKAKIHGNLKVTGNIEGLKDNFMQNVYPALFHNWESINGFTASHTNTGAFALGLLQGTPSTGATNNSRVCLYGNAALALIGYTPLLANFRTRINPSTVMTNCTVWLGLISNPTAPTATEHHAAFKIAEGVIYASCGNGTNGNLTSTGITAGQYTITDLYIKEKAGSIEYYVNGELKVTFTTNLPNDGINPKLTFYMINTTGANRSIALFPYWFMQGR